jgi:hypothetical protein
VFDQAGNFDGTSTFKALTAGIYLIGSTLALTASPFLPAEDGLDFILHTTGGIYYFDTCNIYNASSYNNNFYKTSGSQLVKMAANDTATITVAAFHGATNNISIAPTYCTFWAYQVA